MLKLETVTAIILAFIGSQAFTTLVGKYQSKTDITKQNIQTAMEMSEKLRKDYSDLSEKYDKLQEKYDLLKDDFDEMESENTRLKTRLELKGGV